MKKIKIGKTPQKEEEKISLLKFDNNGGIANFSKIISSQ